MALRWHGRGDVRLDEVDPPPPPGPGQLQLAVCACGICGTDVEEWREGPVLVPVGTPHPLSGQRAPITLGHELAGKVVAAGPGASAQVGDLVAVDGLASCQQCRECRRGAPNRCAHFGQVGLTSDGGLQPLVNVPAEASVVMPQGAPPEAGALAETLSVAVRALRRAHLRPGEATVIVGCGPVGLLAVQAARAMGAASIVVLEPLASRRSAAMTLGADLAIDTEAGGAGQGLAADVAVECSGRPESVAAAISSVGPAGRVALVGIGKQPAFLNALDVVQQEKTIVGSFSHVCSEDFTGALAMIGSGAIRWDGMLTWVPLARSLDEGLLALERQPHRYLKIMISPEAA
jgi:(R,R)-butanediol dehydrogenase / meso-butanediol dehydrogenase / diacetyl reductase